MAVLNWRKVLKKIMKMNFGIEAFKLNKGKPELKQKSSEKKSSKTVPLKWGRVCKKLLS